MPDIAARARRSRADMLRLSQRDIDGLMLCGEHFGAPADLLGSALRVEPRRLYRITARWRQLGFAEMGRLGPGPAWYWLTREGMTATGLGFPATRPPLGRVAHTRAVLATRVWLQNSPLWQDSQAWWHSERRVRAEHPAAGRKGHLPDGEIHWPSLEGRPYAGQVWAIEVERTPKPIDRTTRIMTELLTSMQYAQVLYLTTPAASSVVTRAADLLSPAEKACLLIRDLPPTAYTPGSGGMRM